jgi:hypothetical protein
MEGLLKDSIKWTFVFATYKIQGIDQVTFVFIFPILKIGQ